tara:strand:+ start:107 stop:319 length:213 start_codon:yes stop_codon:yes gene_type:complete
MPSEIVCDTKGNIFELQLWEDIKKDCGYTDDNKGYKYGCHSIDNDGQIIDCNWFKTEKDRTKFIEENEDE